MSCDQTHQLIFGCQAAAQIAEASLAAFGLDVRSRKQGAGEPGSFFGGEPVTSTRQVNLELSLLAPTANIFCSVPRTKNAFSPYAGATRRSPPRTDLPASPPPCKSRRASARAISTTAARGGRSARPGDATVVSAGELRLGSHSRRIRVAACCTCRFCSRCDRRRHKT